MNKKRIIIAGLIACCLVAYLAYYFYGSKLMEKSGVYTVAKITGWESAEQGSDLYFDIYFNGKTFRSHSGGGYSLHVGKLYYVKVLSDNPNQYKLSNIEVPECILIQGIPPNGWKEIPQCK